MQEKIKLLIAEDNGYLSSNIKDFMASQPEIEVVGVAVNAQEALEMVKLDPAHRPDYRPDYAPVGWVCPSGKASSGQYGKMP